MRPVQHWFSVGYLRREGPDKAREKESLNYMCNAYQLSPSNQVSPTIFDNPISLKWREEMFSIISKNMRPKNMLHLQERVQFSYLPSCTTLALTAIPHPTALGLQTGRHGSARQEIRKLKNNRKGK